MKLTLYVALLWAVWHLPDHFAEEGWGVEALITALVVFAIEVFSLFFARALFAGSTTGPGTVCCWWRSSMPVSMPQSASSRMTWCQGRTRQDS
jgi:hypothetical protein